MWSALLRMAEALRPEYDAILERIMRSPYVHIDETTLRVGKKKMWVWIVATEGMSYYFVDTRAINRIKEILDGYDGIIIVDGYHTSGLLAPHMVQRCTAHMDRDFKKWAKTEDLVMPERRIMRNFAARGRALIREARDAKRDGCGPKRYEEMCARLDNLLGYYDRYPEIAKQVAKVRNAGHSLFTFMKYVYVDSTNNLAERELREVVKHRAVKSLLRTTQGAEIFSILLTISMTHKDGNILDLLKKTPGPERAPGAIRRVLRPRLRLAARLSTKWNQMEFCATQQMGRMFFARLILDNHLNTLLSSSKHTRQKRTQTSPDGQCWSYMWSATG